MENIPLSWREWTPLVLTLAHVLLILLLALVVMSVSRRLIGRAGTYMKSRVDSLEHAKRVDTLGRVFRYVAAVAIGLIAAMLILSELGISIAPILGAAGVVGLAVGFGAQSLVKDFFSGFFILLENQVRLGDVVEVGGKAGLVEEVTLRYVRLRDYDGNVHFVPNGEITVVSNYTLDFAQSVIDLRVAYREDVDEALKVMRTVAEALQADPAFAPKFLAPVEMVGVERWEDSAVILRCRFRVVPIEQWTVRREYLRRVKRAFDDAGIEIPYPHLTVYAGVDKKGQSPAFALRAAAPLEIASSR